MTLSADVMTLGTLRLAIIDRAPASKESEHSEIQPIDDESESRAPGGQGTVIRNALRQIAGQLPDYGRSPTPRHVVLVPSRPRADLLAYLAAAGVAMIYVDEDRLVARRELARTPLSGPTATTTAATTTNAGHSLSGGPAFSQFTGGSGGI